MATLLASISLALETSAGQEVWASLTGVKAARTATLMRVANSLFIVCLSFSCCVLVSDAAVPIGRHPGTRRRINAMEMPAVLRRTTNKKSHSCSPDSPSPGRCARPLAAWGYGILSGRPSYLLSGLRAVRTDPRWRLCDSLLRLYVPA